MGLFRGLRRPEADALPQDVTANTFLVPIAGNEVDEQVVRLACTLARRQQSRVVMLHIIEVPRSLPVTADMNIESSRFALERAAQVAEKLGIQATTEVIQARDAGGTIVDEAKNMEAGLILLGLPRLQRMGTPSLGKTVPHVLLHAHCRVIVVRPA
ncbi:MAG: universal stress protein [Chloroflexi bacterium]|nr:universal stress protein [Chloroflexota bacterium]